MEHRSTQTAELILDALANGAFAMAEDRFAREIYLVEPAARAILPLNHFYMPRRLRRTVRHDLFEIHIDNDFDEVIHACAARPRTWINRQIIDAYNILHERGYAHSLESRQDGKLVGGLYGVAVGAAFFGESMFARKRDASKTALVHLVARLIAGRFTLLDAQFMTKHLRQFGARMISAASFKARLAHAQQEPCSLADFYRLPDRVSGLRALQEIGQIS